MNVLNSNLTPYCIMDFDINANHQRSQTTLSQCASCCYRNPLKSTRMEDPHRPSKNRRCIYETRKIWEAFPLLCFCLSLLSRREAANACPKCFPPSIPECTIHHHVLQWGVRVKEDPQPQSKTDTHKFTFPHSRILHHQFASFSQLTGSLFPKVWISR